MKRTSPNVFTDKSRLLSLFLTMFPCTTCLADLTTFKSDSRDILSSDCYECGNACSLLTVNSRSLMDFRRGNAIE